jgi:hypothetical protein
MRTASILSLVIITGCEAAEPPPPASQGAAPRLLNPADPAGSVADFASLQGRWRVVGVGTAPGPVQAYGRDDPAWMGRDLLVAGKRLVWARAAGNATSADDVCSGAATMRITGPAAARVAGPVALALRQLGVGRPDPHEIACLDGGSWGGDGGGAMLYPIDPRTLVMSWYDNLLLKLRWQGPQ